MPTAIDADRLQRILATGPLEVEGRLIDASNVVLRVWAGMADERVCAVYKPVRGERPLWDFPEGSLASREFAAYLIARAGGWECVPVTALRTEGPYGPGSVQQWVGPLEPGADQGLLRVDPVALVPADFLPVIGVRDEDDQPLVVSHAGEDRVREIALLDVVLNNADRKGSALIPDAGRLYAVDHGLTLHTDDKLRTVLWGFAGTTLTAGEQSRLVSLRADLDAALGEKLRGVIHDDEVVALKCRIDDLLAAGRMPAPPEDRHPLPWPLW